MVIAAQRPDLHAPAPFLKWAGGKTQLLDEILSRFPAKVRTYHEPFIGGGAVFWAMAAERRFRRAVIADRNPELVLAYRTVRDQVEPLIERLREHQAHATDEAYFYRVRAEEPASLSPVERAARTLFLNRTCFNGLYRVNRRGGFNVPFGRYANPRVVNPELLRACSAALAEVDVLEGDFEVVARRAGSGDALYLDPPYVPVSSTSSFTSYAQFPFGPREHERLAAVFRECCERGVATILSNSDCAATRALYADLEVRTVLATRAINSVGARRGAVSEVLVTGLAPAREAAAGGASVTPLHRRVG
jgi:DNA adenine methylase